jgi:hypothetical protein
MNLKKILLSIAFLAVSIGIFGMKVQTVKAQTVEELLAQIAALQAHIAQLQKQLAELREEKPPVWCHDFNINLRYGDRGDEVHALQMALLKQGFHIIRGETQIPYFGDFTASAVVGFQEKYKEDILAPWGVEHGTGFVGPTTRAKLNELYGCKIKRPVIISILPSQGLHGEIVNLVIKGYNFTGAGDLSGCGISPVSDRGFELKSCKEVSDTQINAIFSIAEDAVIGPRYITVQTPKGGKSNAITFTIIEKEAPYIKVISPNGGEKWVKGEIYEIKWCGENFSPTGPGGYSHVYLLKGTFEYGLVYKDTTSGIAGCPAMDVYRWKAGYLADGSPVPIGDDYRIKIEFITPTGEIIAEGQSDDYFSIVAKEVYEVNPYDADIKTCTDSKGRVWPATGEGSCSWFVWGGCTYNKYYFVNPGQTLKFHVWTDSCPGCVCYHPNFYVYEYENGKWVFKKYFDLPDVKGITRDEYYTPSSNRIKIYAPNCFYLKIYSSKAVEIPGGYEISNVRLNEKGSSITVKPGQSVSISLDYKIWSRTGCPACIDQIVLGMDDKALTCAYHGIPGIYPGRSGSYSGTITAPETPGTYYLYTAYATQYTCEDAKNLYPKTGYELLNKKISTIIVTPEEKSITVISPNGGEVWVIGNTYPIKWTTTGYDSNASIQISLRDARYDPNLPEGEMTIANTINNGSYDWTIPSTVKPTSEVGPTHKIVIYIEGGGPGKFDESDNYFSIIAEEIVPVGLKYIEDQLASIANAVSQIMEVIKELMGR